MVAHSVMLSGAAPSMGTSPVPGSHCSPRAGSGDGCQSVLLWLLLCCCCSTQEVQFRGFSVSWDKIHLGGLIIEQQ